jgi:hypothetical protein
VVLDRISVCALRETGITLTDSTTFSFYHTSIKRNEQDETFVVPLTFFRRDRRYSVGDQQQEDLQRWLSPPDPSTNHNFVSNSRHKGTAAWFFESSALTEWKAKGSLLWIHGKRTSFNLQMSALRL